MSSSFLSMLFTVTDQDEFLNAIDVLRDSLYIKDLDYKTRLKKMRADFATVLGSELENIADKAKKLDTLRLSVKQMRVLNVCVGFNYTLEFVPKIADWVKNNVGEDVVIDLQIGLNLIGGATISFGGKYRDYSVKSQLDKVWKN